VGKSDGDLIDNRAKAPPQAECALIIQLDSEDIYICGLTLINALFHIGR
jgi:hypothetical protein